MSIQHFILGKSCLLLPRGSIPHHVTLMYLHCASPKAFREGPVTQVSPNRLAVWWAHSLIHTVFPQPQDFEVRFWCLGSKDHVNLRLPWPLLHRGRDLPEQCSKKGRRIELRDTDWTGLASLRTWIQLRLKLEEILDHFPTWTKPNQINPNKVN